MRRSTKRRPSARIILILSSLLLFGLKTKVASAVLARFWMINRVYWHRTNRAVMAMHKFVIADLMDSGTASDIGFSYAMGKKIYGYRGDLRRSGDNEGSIVNLQLEYWIEKSGGCIVTTTVDLRNVLITRLYKK